MAKGKGIQLNAEGDLLIAGGTLAIGDTTYQNVYLILSSHKGEWKEHPLIGAGLTDSLADENPSYWKYTIRSELARDGLTVNNLQIQEGQVLIDAKYR